ncbi:P-loop NTPase fold protein [Calothrix sp. CCY 0018]|uniref:P-loop NTPase fold protein n=1 Tax=Calothrix sp. CCY 0018 TaxID=3103864 RepID=UPI0039C5E15B
MTQDNKSINSHIEEYLDYYCSLSHAPGFAVLLKGQWGCGKTWFIEKYREKLKKNNQKCLYVSLYGMTSFSEIEDAFFQQLHPVLSSKGMALTGKIFKGFLKGTLKIDLNNDSNNDGTWNIGIPDINLPEYLKNTDKSILIFDDLERCQIDISNLLGYINYFVEHDDLKVIIIANEDELLKPDINNSGGDNSGKDNSSTSYKVIKEKLIGKTFGVSLDFEGALESFIAIVDNSDVRQFLSDNIELIENLYKKAEFENLRCLRQIILDFDRIYKVLPEKATSKVEILQEILKVLMAFSIEIKRGNMLATDISKLEYGRISEYMLRKTFGVPQASSSVVKENIIEENNKEESPLAKIVNTYPELDLPEPFLGKVWWQTFFDKGILDTQELETSLSTSKYFQDENTPNWVKLWHFAYLTDDEFDNLLKKVESEYADRQFIELGIIKHIAGLFLMFSDVGVYHKSKKEIFEEAKLYIDYLKDNKTINIPESQYTSIGYIIGGGYNGLGYQGKEIQEFKELCSYIKEVQELAKVESMPGAAQDLVNIMQDDVWKFYTMICISNSQEQKYSKIPILKYIEPSVFVEKLLSMKFDDKQCVGGALTERYKFSNTNEKLLSELDWLQSIRDLLLKEADTRKGKISGYRLELLTKEYFNQAIEKLEKKAQG